MLPPEALETAEQGVQILGEKNTWEELFFTDKTFKTPAPPTLSGVIRCTIRQYIAGVSIQPPL